MNGDAMAAMDGSQYPKLAQWERQFAEQLAAKEESEQTALAEKKVGFQPPPPRSRLPLTFVHIWDGPPQDRQKPSASLIYSTVTLSTAA